MNINHTIVQKQEDAARGENPMTEAEGFLLEHAMQLGFEPLDEDAVLYVCTPRQLFALVKTREDMVDRLRAIIDEVHSWVVCGCIAPAEDMAQNFEHITKITTPDDTTPTDSQRVEWLLPVVTGEESFTANQRTAILGACLMAGLDGRKALDRAMEMVK